MQAKRTETIKDKKDGRDLVSFSGSVVLTIEKGATFIRIKADQVNFDRERNMLYASGNVYMEETDESNAYKEMKGTSLLLNTNSLEGVFDQTKLKQTQTYSSTSGENSVMVLSANLFSRDDSGVVAFKKSQLTFCEDENPHWKIKATRAWLLPGGEFSFLNALLYVGHIPVAYLPFFYYPKDEMIFHPSFGYRPRVGYYTQTTTYLIGRKPLSTQTDSDGFFNLSSTNRLMEQRREGLFLRNLDTPLPLSKQSSDYLKMLGDIYSNLGGMFGFDGSFVPQDSFFSSFKFSALMGLSRNLYFTEGDALYSPYNKAGKSEWNKSTFTGITMPFRYYANVAFETNTSPFRFAVSLPVYSDPYFNSDFMNRKEDINWLNFITEPGVTRAAEAEKEKDTEIDSFSWKMNGSWSPNLSKLSPYFNFSITSYRSQIDFQSKSAKKANSVSPDRKFFYPSKIVPFEIYANFSGTILQYPFLEKTTEKTTPPIPELEKPEFFTKTEDQSSGTNTVPTFPMLSVPSLSKREVEPFTFKMSYSVTPGFTSLYTYSPNAWATPYESSWDQYMSNFLSVSGKGILKEEAAIQGGVIGFTHTYTLSTMYQKHPDISETYYPNEKSRSNITLSDYKARKFDLTESTSFSIKPFIFTKYFFNSGIFFNSEKYLIKTEFVGTEKDPLWELKKFEDKRENYLTNEVTLTLAADEPAHSQKLSLRYSVPPLLPSRKVSADFVFPGISTHMESGMAIESEDDDKWKYLPFVENSNMSFFNNKLNLSQTYKYEIEKKHHEYITASLGYNGFGVDFSSMYTTGYTFSYSKGWQSDKNEVLRPYQLTFKYNSPDKLFKFWHNRVQIKPRIKTVIAWDLLRPPLSYMTFDTEIEMLVSEFTSISFSSESRNDVIFRYIQEGMDYEPQIPGEMDLMTDLLNSFAFGNKYLRQQSGFKLKSLSMAMIHNLDDWNVSSKMTISPRLIEENNSSHYDYSPYFTFSVIWKPVTGVKATVTDEYGDIKLNNK
ncbi:MAG: LPS-assembly protein LptD [Spirochaetaceae bacterium]|nr:LPS-assembly protein LptD [Spirochaetaceae bacterium]MBP5329905.1 LPS-assembly protein LptD [Spirochaetaceae bacterium]